MTETGDLYSGYFLELLSDKHNGHNLIKVACFKSGFPSRIILELTTDDECNHKFGDIVRFRPVGPLEDKTFIKFEKNSEQSYERAEALPELIIYTMKDFQVASGDLNCIHKYRNPDLGYMNIKDHPMVPGAYHSLVFEVVLNPAEDKFSLKVLANQKQPQEQQREVSDREQFEQKVKLYPEIMKIEKDHATNVESVNWKEIGHLKLKKVDERNLVGGIRAIFKLMSTDENKLELFDNRKDAYPVVIIKQCEVDGKYKDDDEKRFEGTVFPRKIGDDNKKNGCIVQLKNDEQKRFFCNHQVGDIYRFDTLPTMKNLTFWEKQRQNENEIYRLTLEETSNPDPLKIQDVIDSAMMDPLELKNLSDKNAPRNDLNDSQLAAIKMALNDHRPLVCIQGPPGTGKSHTLSMLLFRVLKLKEQAVVLTPTKEALKNLKEMTERLCQRRKKEVTLHEHAFMEIKQYHEIINDTEEARETLDHFATLKEQVKNGEKDVDDMWEERENRLKSVKSKIGAEILKNVRIVFATIESSFSNTVMQNKSFNPSYCIIDEAAQVMESQMWPAVHKFKKIVMAGDPKQLPALVLTEEARQFGLNQSVMERIISKKEHFSWIMLEEQYRSHKDITDWSNGAFYNCRLINNTSMEDVIMNDLSPKPTQYVNLYEPFVFVDTSLETDREKRVATYELRKNNGIGENNSSYMNHGEVDYVMQHYKNLVTMSIKPETIAILSPYKAQIEQLRLRMKHLIEQFDKKGKQYGCHKTPIGTVDSVQGQEYDVVIFSLVRSNPKMTLGFVTEIRRLNVAVTRAKRHFMLIGSAFMLHNNHDKLIRNLYDDFRAKNRRFHPANLFGEPGPVADGVRNNYGHFFADFKANSNDPDMIQWIEKYVANHQDPTHWAKVAERRRNIEAEREIRELRAQIEMAKLSLK